MNVLSKMSNYSSENNQPGQSQFSVSIIHLALVMMGPLVPVRQICVCYWNGLKVQHWERKHPRWEQAKNEFSDNIVTFI